MDEHDLLPIAIQRRQSGDHGGGAGFATGDGGPAGQAGKGGAGDGLVAGGDDRDKASRAGGDERLGRPSDDGPAAQAAPLFGSARAGPNAASRRDDDR